MSRRSYEDELATEREMNEEYLRLLVEREERVSELGPLVPRPANTIWHGNTPTVSRPPSDALIGRVSLECDDPDLADFYIGSRHLRSDTMLVISPFGPIAGLFYEGRDWDPRRIPDRDTEPDPGTLQARRSFESRGREIVELVDDVEPEANLDTVFRNGARPPVVLEPPPVILGHPPDVAEPPAPLMGSAIPAPAGGMPPRAPSLPVAVGTLDPGDDVPDEQGDSGSHGTPTEAAEHSDSSAGSPLALRRAESLVMNALDRPRDTRLHSVLSTLQPDQFRFVTWPAAEYLAVQGHPGTGKTIVATHRAAFLTHPDNPDCLKRVGLVGPTDEWTSHVFSVLNETGARGVEVLSMETLIRGLADGQLAKDRRSSGLAHPLHRENERPFQTDWTIGRIAERAVSELAAELSRTTDQQKKMRLVTKRIIEACAMGAPLVTDLTPDCREWLQAARSYDHARGDASYLLFLAGVGTAIQPPSSKALYEHLIVDEVQDLRPAEWRILDALLRGDGNWSLFGDMNQRRADVSWDSWAAVMSHLGLGSDDGSSPEPEVLRTGYRSNDAILRYAGWLLPRSERNQRSLRDGADDSVRVRRVRSEDVLATAEEEARALAEEFSEGVVAVIVWSQESHNRMRNLALECGWRRAKGPANRTTFTLREPPASKDESGRRATLRILRAVQARGLEFDGVMVVEPADFQQNLGRHGSLYTSLTRANKKLVVVHSEPLPQELRGRVRSDPARRRAAEADTRQ